MVFDRGLMWAYGMLAALGVVTCLTTVVIVTIASTWIGLYEESEMCFFLHRFFLASVMFPTTTMSIGSVSSMAMVCVRIYMVFDPEVCYVMFAFMAIFGAGIVSICVCFFVLFWFFSVCPDLPFYT